MPYVVSKMTAGVKYIIYRQTPGGLPQAAAEIEVKGGAGVNDKRTLITPDGVVTPITAKEAEMLKDCPLFKEHEAAGNVKIVTQEPKDADNAAKDLDPDASAPLTPAKYAKQGKKPPKTKAA